MKNFREESPTRVSEQRPMLAIGRGRVIALAIAVGSIFPILLMSQLGNVVVARWAAQHRAADGSNLWTWAAFAGSPILWITLAALGFGLAATWNWSNTSRWMGMIAIGVMWAGLADIAVAGEAKGTATAAAVACILTLWQSKQWPIWGALAMIATMGRVVVSGCSASSAILGVMLGVLGVLIAEYAWFTVSPETQPQRDTAWDS